MTNQRLILFSAGSLQVEEYLSGIRSLWNRIIAPQPGSRLSFCRPGLRYGPCPIKPDIQDPRSRLDRLVARCLFLGESRRYRKEESAEWLARMAQRTAKLTELSSSQLYADRAALIQQLRHSSSEIDRFDDALAHACIAIEKTLHLVPRPNQCLAARAMLHGHCVEMATGEGKTLSIALAAISAALSGTPVHVLTANDYLAARDAAYLETVYRFMGLRSSSVVSILEPAERRKAYGADVVYVTAKQVAFDWLGDALESDAGPDSIAARLSVLIQTKSQKAYKPMLRGLCLAIVDEADSLLVDEARIPLVLAASKSGGSVVDTEPVIALGLAEQLQEDIDFRVMTASRRVQLTDAGRTELTRISKGVAHVWQSSRYREESVGQALTALYRFERDRDYIVRDGRLELLDAHTGRATPDRRLPHGLHSLLELKEKCTASAQHETVLSIPFQQFFRRYIGLTGISGTLSEVSGELHHVYDRFVVHIPSHRPGCRLDLPSMVFTQRSSQLQAMVKDVQRCQELQQPVLVCTRTVEQSLGVSAMLSAHGVVHKVLNAYQDADEAEIISSAGKAGQVTVATTMAGRGTDIPLGETVAQRGGLHVVSLAFNDARRLDRQLAGRAARQGDPGSFQQLHALDDPCLVESMPELMRKVAVIFVDSGWQKAALVLIRWAQRSVEWRHSRERLKLYLSREKLEHSLAFGGKQDHLP